MQMILKESLDLSIIMPCLNEESTVSFCIDEAKEFIKKNHIDGEIIVVDNNSEDKSALIAEKHGARVVTELKRGYGNAIRTGIANSKGSVIIIGDCDTTYDFLHLEAIYHSLAEQNCDMVIGNRYAGNIEKGSMSWLHRWGVRFLSLCARLKFHTNIYDFHCGLRGLSRNAAKQLVFGTEGMEFATEMIAEAAKNNLRILQIPVILRRCEYQRKSKLKTFRDGFRHLRYILKM